MTPKLEEQIRGLAAIAKPTEDQIQDVLDGWDRVFVALKLEGEDQEKEFNAMMRLRVQGGIVSIVAPKLPL